MVSVQCKSTMTVALDGVAKEVCLAHFLKLSMIGIIGRTGNEERSYGKRIIRHSSPTVVTFERKDTDAIIELAVRVVHVLNRRATRAMKLKVP